MPLLKMTVLLAIALIPLNSLAEEIIPLNYNPNNENTAALEAIKSNDAKIVDGKYKDLDQDGVADKLDLCTNSILNVKVDQYGCELDSDKDGVYDRLDQCPNSESGVNVNIFGCEGDEDLDGVLDSKDQCPETEEGVTVDATGCKKILDSDKDGVNDDTDQCPNTPIGASVNEFGCQPVDFVMTNINFESNKHDIGTEQAVILKADAAKLQKLQSKEIVLITGHTDWQAPQSHNLPLSWRRANSAKQFIINEFGYDPAVIYIDGKGELEPIANNQTADGRYQNRRIEMQVMQKNDLPSSSALNLPAEMQK